MTNRTLVALWTAVLVGLPITGPEMTARPDQASTPTLVPAVVVASKPTTTNYVGYYARWGREGTCMGGPSFPSQDPDMQDIWVVDDVANEYVNGETAHNGCDGPHNGTFYSGKFIECANQNGGDCPLITGEVLSHVHHENCDH